ncbi:putative PEP-CTERM system TPR-repeat lipoprotein [Luteitalea pratensis]|uniref:Putative PEP-CTERM system TPR-repeat lipoprotein n=1 Tax=Luteitalea pratensis TaxID=1855912 RepID=A0A143PTW0_LUTPR|nr:tetratricopeptide repeat protein [Luteitalea pratensis]AMY11234.1 putative PEP-CTERM system TPR-repeat lipoprotein [Luteitalea pratensis]
MTWLGRIACVLLSAMSAMCLPVPATAQGAATLTPSVLVMPLRPLGDDPRALWLGEGVALLVADGLTSLGRPAVPRIDRVAAFDALELPADRELSRATLLRAAIVMGVRDLVTGTVSLAGETLTVSVRVVQVEAGRGNPEIREQGPLGDVVAIAGRIAATIAGAPPGTPVVGYDPPPSLEVFEAFVKGLVAETPATQLRFLEQAVKDAPGYARAHLAIWEVCTDEEQHARALAAAQAVPASSRFSRRARFAAGLSLTNLKRWEEAFTAYKSLLDESATAAVYNNLGVIQARRGSITAQTGKPAWYFSRASEAASDSPDYFFNLGYAYWLDKDTPAAIYWLREVVRRRPADGEAHYVLAAALLATNNTAEATRERDLARQLSSRFDEWDQRPSEDAVGGVPRGLERASETEATPVRADSGLVSTTQQDHQQLARFHFDRGLRLEEQLQDREAISEFRKSLYLAPYDAQTHLALGRVLVRSGRLRDAIESLKISLWSAESLDARLLLAEALLGTGETAEAQVHADRALQLAPESAVARALVERVRATPARTP